jgi:cobalt-zinc-cadmium resistance protein CzcA
VVVGGIGLVPLFILVAFPALIDRFGRPRDLAQQEAALAARRTRAGLPA